MKKLIFIFTFCILYSEIGHSTESACSQIFSAKLDLQFSNNEIFRIANITSSLRLYWENRVEGEYDELDLARIIANLSQEQKQSLLREIPNQTFEKQRALQILKLGSEDVKTWIEWVSELKENGASAWDLNVDMVLLSSLTQSLRLQILSELTKSFPELTKKRKNETDLAPRRAVTYIFLSIIKPFEIFMKHPQRPGLAFVEFFNRMAKLSGNHDFNGEKIMRFFKEAQLKLNSNLKNKNESVLIYGSLTNGTVSKKSDLDYDSNASIDIHTLLFNAAQSVFGYEVPVRNDLPESYSKVQSFAAEISPVTIEIQPDQIIFWVHPNHTKSYTQKEIFKMKSKSFTLKYF